jgi:DNA-binding NarL/FixJ family response regulator
VAASQRKDGGGARVGPEMVPTPQADHPPRLSDSDADVTVAVVASEPFISHRIATALSCSNLPAAKVARSPSELIEVAASRPEVAVLACDPSTAKGMAAIRTLARGLPKTRLVIVSLAERGRRVRQALAAGGAGIVVESELESTLAPTMRAVLVGHVSLPRELQRAVVTPAFSHREKQVLAMVVRGLGNRQIASRLFLAESTVKSHLATAFAKLGVRSRKEAAALLIDPDEQLGAQILGVELDQPLPDGGALRLGARPRGRPAGEAPGGSP